MPCELVDGLSLANTEDLAKPLMTFRLSSKISNQVTKHIHLILHCMHLYRLDQRSEGCCLCCYGIERYWEISADIRFFFFSKQYRLHRPGSGTKTCHVWCFSVKQRLRMQTASKVKAAQASKTVWRAVISDPH